MSTLKMLGDWFYYENELYKKEYFSELIAANSNRIYEVLRVINGKALFLDNHFERFLHSLAEMKLSINLEYKQLIEIIENTITKNNIDTCNLRFEVILKESSSILAAYLVPFKYPLPLAYKEGVTLSSYNIERHNPHIKQSEVNDKVRAQIQAVFEEKKVFEVILVNHLGNITEGSRSNIFFIKNNTLYTPPSTVVLEGITRRKTIEIAKGIDIKINESPIPYSEIKNFDACFLTGTSPKILPVNVVDNFEFNIQNTVLKQLIIEYDKLIQESIN